MASETSVVTPQRFQEGFSYADYMDQIKVNKARFEGFYKFQIKTEDAAALKELASRKAARPRWLWRAEDGGAQGSAGVRMRAGVGNVAGVRW